MEKYNLILDISFNGIDLGHPYINIHIHSQFVVKYVKNVKTFFTIHCKGCVVLYMIHRKYCYLSVKVFLHNRNDTKRYNCTKQQLCNQNSYKLY